MVATGHVLLINMVATGHFLFNMVATGSLHQHGQATRGGSGITGRYDSSFSLYLTLILHTGETFMKTKTETEHKGRWHTERCHWLNEH